MNTNKTLNNNEGNIVHKLSKRNKKDFLMKLNDEMQLLDEDNNYIDYFIELGVKPEIYKEKFLYDASSLNEIDQKLNPEIIGKFPRSNKKK
jgi:hypothetical protein